MKIIITEEQFNNLIPPSVKRRMNPEDFVLIDNIIQTNKKYYLNFSFDIFFESLIRDSLNEFIEEYKVKEINPNLDGDVWALEENLIYEIFWQLTPFLKKKYYDEYYDYYMEYHRRRGNITESEHLKGLFSELPSYLKRRVTMEDLEWLDKSIIGIIPGTPTRRDFDLFCQDVLGDLLHEFVVERKDDEIDTVEDPDYGLVYSEDGFDKVVSIYWELMPFLKKRYEIKLRQSFERKRQQLKNFYGKI